MKRLAASLLLALCAVSVAAPITIIGAPTRLQVDGGGGGDPDPEPGDLYELPEERRTLWQPGVTYAPTSGDYAPANPPSGWTGGIPARATICATLSPSGGSDTSAINSAISSCPAGQTVLLNCGQFSVTGTGIQLKSGVTLRGCGPGDGMRGALNTLPSSATATLLVKTDGSSNPYPAIRMGGNVNLNSMYQVGAFAEDAVKGANSVTLSALPAAGLSAGQIVFVNETYDSSITWYNENGGQGSSNDYNGWGEGQTGPVANSRPIGQAMEVKSVVGNLVTFTTPFHTTYRTSKSAHLGTVNATAVTWAGVEDLFTTGGDGGDGGGSILIGYGAYCWVKHVESSGHGPNYGGGLVRMMGSFRSELRDSYLHSDSTDISAISPGGGYYNLVIDSYAADFLVENNISWIGNKVMVIRGAGAGGVVAYNYMDDAYGAGYPNQGEVGINADHMATPFQVLFEGNVSFQIGSDSRWGNANTITFFRNWARTQRVSAWPSTIASTSVAYQNPLTTYVYTSGGQSFYYEDEYNRVGINISSNHWNYNLVGNVIGFSGMPLLSSPQSHYKVPQTAFSYQQVGSSIPSSINGGHVPMYRLGARDSLESSSGGNGLDSSVGPTALRDGNFDYVTNEVHWHGIGGTSESETTPPGASTGGSALPDSLYLPSKPSFFGSGTWPPIDGSSSSNPLPGSVPAYARFIAGTPNEI